jgi:hypothetical protein
MKNDKLLKAAEVLFCDKNPLKVQMAVFAGTERLTFLDFGHCEGNLFYLLQRTEKYIKEHMDWRVEFGGPRRKEIPEIPVEAIREALVNSFCHRDYQAPKGNEVAIYKDRIEIYNPGPFPEGLTPEDYIKKNLPSNSRNPLIANTLYKSREIEQWGSGLKRIYEMCSKQGVRVEFKIEKDSFTTILYRPKKSIEKYVKGEMEEITESPSPAPPPVKPPSVLHRAVVFALYGIGISGLWGLFMGRIAQQIFKPNITLILSFSMIAGAVIGIMVGFSRKLAWHIVYGYFIGVLLCAVVALITLDIKAASYAFIFGPAIGTLLSMLVKHLKNKGILIT